MITQRFGLSWSGGLGRDRDALLEASCNSGRYMVDLLRLPRSQPNEVLAKFEAYGLEHIEEALAPGRGLVLVTAHIGNWDLAGAFLAAQGYPVNVIVETLQPRRWNDLV